MLAILNVYTTGEWVRSGVGQIGLKQETRAKSGLRWTGAVQLAAEIRQTHCNRPSLLRRHSLALSICSC